MTPSHRVVWSQGMLLQPHHFQQEGRHVEHVLDRRIVAAHPYAWGCAGLQLDEAALASGHLGLRRAAGVLPDGTAFSMPDGDDLPPPLEIPPELTQERIFLAAPRALPGRDEFDFGLDDLADGGGGGGGDRALARYRVVDRELRDAAHAIDDPEPLQLGAVRFVLKRERDLNEHWSGIAVARVQQRRPDGQVILDAGWIPPQTRIEASGHLHEATRLLHGLLTQRARALAGAMGQLGHGTGEVADFLMLMLLNRHEPPLRQFVGAPSVHPWLLHQHLLSLAGELCTFAPEERLPPAWPVYRHDDLQAVFAPLLADLRRHLSAVMERHALQIPLIDRAHGVRTAVVQDAELMRQAGFVLAVRAQLPAEQLRTRFPSQSKLGPVDRLRDLVNLQLSGVALHSLPVAPRQLPFHSGNHYFELKRQGELWRQIERSGALALHVAGDFPGRELELWAIRQAG